MTEWVQSAIWMNWRKRNAVAIVNIVVIICLNRFTTISYTFFDLQFFMVNHLWFWLNGFMTGWLWAGWMALRLAWPERRKPWLDWWKSVVVVRLKMPWKYFTMNACSVHGFELQISNGASSLRVGICSAAAAAATMRRFQFNWNDCDRNCYFLMLPHAITCNDKFKTLSIVNGRMNNSKSNTTYVQYGQMAEKKRC